MFDRTPTMMFHDHRVAGSGADPARQIEAGSREQTKAHARPIFVLMLASVVAASCSGTLESEAGRRPAVIAFYSEPVVVEAPDTVKAGTAFEATVRSYGDGCVTRGTTEVEQDGPIVVVRPYDRHSGASVCTQQLKMFDHRVTIVVDEPGLAEIRVHGTELPADSAVVVTRSVVVE